MFSICMLLTLVTSVVSYMRFASGNLADAIWLACGALLFAILGVAALVINATKTVLATIKSIQNQQAETEVNR